MTADIAEELKTPMLKCLKRIVTELKEKLQEINIAVEKMTGTKLGLEIVSISEVSENDFHIQVKGVTFSGKVETTTFQLLWWNHICPTHFHLHQMGCMPLNQGRDFIYRGMVNPTSENLAKEIAIYTHHMQIPGVLSRIG